MASQTSMRSSAAPEIERAFLDGHYDAIITNPEGVRRLHVVVVVDEAYRARGERS